MISQNVFDKLMGRLVSGGVTVTYPDGDTKNYGPDKPYLHITFNKSAVFRHMLTSPSLGFGEAYMNGDVDIDGPIDELLHITAGNKAAFKKYGRLQRRKRQKNTPQSQMRLVQHHYDLGNKFYKLWLDESMTYSCAYFKKPDDSLEKAQKQKVDHLLKKLQLKKGMSLLDIGSGWGTLLITAAKKYNISGVGITLSREQHKHSVARAKAEGLDKQIKFKLMNYRDLAETSQTFDRIISVGMFEHVGQANHASYFEAVNKLLVEGGLSVLHTITSNNEEPIDKWIDKYIFPGGYIPSIREVVDKLPDYDFRLIDYENLRMHYAKTLDEWLRRFESHKEEITKMYDDRFVRMWRLYLATSSGSFRYAGNGLSQFVYTKGRNNKLPLTRDFLYR